MKKGFFIGSGMVLATLILIAATTDYRILRIYDTITTLRANLQNAQIAITSDSLQAHRCLVYKDGNGKLYFCLADSQDAVIKNLTVTGTVSGISASASDSLTSEHSGKLVFVNSGYQISDSIGGYFRMYDNTTDWYSPTANFSITSDGGDININANDSLIFKSKFIKFHTSANELIGYFSNGGLYMDNKSLYGIDTIFIGGRRCFFNPTDSTLKIMGYKKDRSADSALTLINLLPLI